MYENTLTDLFIKQGLCEPMKGRLVLDGDPDEPHYLLLDGEEIPQKEEKDRE